MDSSATTVLLGGFGPGCTVNSFVTTGLGTTTVDPSVGSSDLLLLGAT